MTGFGGALRARSLSRTQRIPAAGPKNTPMTRSPFSPSIVKKSFHKSAPTITATIPPMIQSNPSRMREARTSAPTRTMKRCVIPMNDSLGVTYWATKETPNRSASNPSQDTAMPSTGPLAVLTARVRAIPALRSDGVCTRVAFEQKREAGQGDQHTLHDQQGVLDRGRNLHKGSLPCPKIASWSWKLISQHQAKISAQKSQRIRTSPNAAPVAMIWNRSATRATVTPDTAINLKSLIGATIPGNRCLASTECVCG